jgi:hypothetical protein
LIFATESAERVQGRLSFRHNLVRDQLAGAVPTGRGLDLAKSLHAAAEILRRDRSKKSSGTEAVILFTDLQDNAINAISANRPVVKPDPKPPSPLVIVDVGSEQAKNGAAMNVKLPARILPEDSNAELIGSVRPVDKDHPCLVELYIDERRVVQKLVDPKGEAVVNVSLDFFTGSAGAHTGRLHLPDSDRLPLDQDFLFSYTAGRPASALVIERPGFGDRKGTGFFLAAALSHGADSSAGMSGLECVVQPVREFSRAELARHRVIILADCGMLSTSTWDALQQWTSDGGGLFVWMGPNTDPTIGKYGYQKGLAFDGLLPGIIQSLTKLPQPQTINVTQPDHPVLSHLNAGTATVLSESKVTQFVRIAPQPQDQNATVILSLNDGTPLLLEKLYGRGRVLSIAIDPGLECSDLPKRGEAFVTLVLDAARLLSGEESEVGARLGMPLVLSLPAMPADGQVLWKKPGAPVPVIIRVDAVGKTEIKGAPVSNFASPVSAIVPLIDTHGIHQFSWYPAGAVSPLSKFVAVNSDPSESKLSKAAVDVTLKALANWNPETVQNVFDARPFAMSNGFRSGNREFTTALMLLLLGVLLTEAFLSNRLYKGAVEAEEKATEPLISESENVDISPSSVPVERTDDGR